MTGFRDSDRPMGFFRVHTPHDIDGKPIGYHINTLRENEFKKVTLTPLQEKILRKLNHKEIPKPVYDALKNFDDIAENVKFAGKAAFNTDCNFNIEEYFHFCNRLLKKEPEKSNGRTGLTASGR